MQWSGRRLSDERWKTLLGCVLVLAAAAAVCTLAVVVFVTLT